MIEDDLFTELTAVAGVDAEARRLLAALDGPDVPFAAAPGSSGASSGRDRLRKAWRWMRVEIHLLLCTDDARYSDERTQLRVASKPVVAVFTAALIHQFGFEAGTAGSIAAIGLLLPLRMGVNAWCRSYATGEEESESALLRGEREGLVEVGNLVGLLESANSDEQLWSAYRLAEMRHQPSTVVPRVSRLLGHADPYVRGRAATVIGMYGTDASGVDGLLTRLLSDEDRQVRYSASKSLTQVLPSDAGSVSQILSALEHEQDESIVENLVEALAMHGHAASGALSVLEMIRRREEEKRGMGNHVSRVYRAVVDAQKRIKSQRK